MANIFDEFITYIKTGRLDKAKEFYANHPDINISAGNEYAFRFACDYRHLEVAEWLLYIKPDINISANNGYAFRFACYNNHLNVAKWLLEIKPSINIINDCVFKWVCVYGHLEVAKWLLQIKPDIIICFIY